MLIHGLSDEYDLEYAHKQVIKLKQSINPEYKDGTVMNLMNDNNQNENSLKSLKNDNEMELAFGKPWNFTEIKEKSEKEKMRKGKNDEREGENLATAMATVCCFVLFCVLLLLLLLLLSSFSCCLLSLFYGIHSNVAHSAKN